MLAIPSKEIGAPIPNNTAHAVSVTLPTWEATVGYEEGEQWVTSKMTSGYPRFFIHSKIQELCKHIEEKFGRENEKAWCFPSYEVAKRCREFVKEKSHCNNVRILQLRTPPPKTKEEESYRKEAKIAVVFVHDSEWSIAKQYWQHSGEGISSRMGEYVLQELQISENNLNEDKDKEYKMFIEERFGRNLNLSYVNEAKQILKRRIAGTLKDDSDLDSNQRVICEDDIFLYPTGMASIFNAFLACLNTSTQQEGSQLEKSVCFGFPYVDTLNILKKFGPGVQFYGFGDDDSLNDLENKLKSGEKIQSFFCECPSNPLLKTPNLKKVYELSQIYKFPVVVDETVGNFLNIDVLPYADIVVSSLTKVFSGDSNVMAGSLVLNPKSQYYEIFTKYFTNNYEDIFWAEDAIYLERNSRDFQSRSSKVNKTTEAVVNLFQNSSLIKEIFYPKLVPSKKYYDELKTPHGGYGGLISLVFHNPNAARVFFNEVNLSKGPSLGTNFTLACPYAILAHYQELDEVEKWGVDRNIVRISIGLEDQSELLEILQHALNLAALE
ncbi:putative cystathionine gamma-synthase [Wickerhamomyces ciferrii]|uniref:cystathionine gamma-synthase n=1 Tax=Wickerhamomyces ciferrii (strain ATCC 14091 / BCRC 22168 / CBS 111 / JCM 3599 / NBRC 0793 / NRRL Y-1031 F-60-10) TaxID=1206466 RepID=K0KGV4_WICCF|nr:putative cystathionine gamma-synthase [Wickerhamomyces ciferrii]CCH44410.1 putative cystathionine gamma-synthase [Wickerhamomyces ciferrii]